MYELVQIFFIGLCMCLQTCKSKLFPVLKGLVGWRGFPTINSWPEVCSLPREGWSLVKHLHLSLSQCLSEGAAKSVQICQTSTTPGFGSFFIVFFVFFVCSFLFCTPLLLPWFSALPACLHAWCFCHLPACLRLTVLPAAWLDMATVGIAPLLCFPCPLCIGLLTNSRLYCTPRFGRQVPHSLPAGQPAQRLCSWHACGMRCRAGGWASPWAHTSACHEHLHASCWVAAGGQGRSRKFDFSCYSSSV